MAVCTGKCWTAELAAYVKFLLLLAQWYVAAAASVLHICIYEMHDTSLHMMQLEWKTCYNKVFKFIYVYINIYNLLL